jgi:cbb3-type cytochrome oxidase subunit 1
MEWFIKAFIRASLIWFTLGIALGLAMSARPEWVVYRPAHAHMNVVGFLVMMVFGVGYQLLPRLFGGPLWSAKFAIAHLWLANLGLAAMVAGFMMAPHMGAPGNMVTTIGGSLYTLGALLFVINLWQTFSGADARHRPPPGAAAAPRKLPTLGE